LLSSPALPERLFRTVGITKQDKGKPFRLSKPAALLGSVEVMLGTNVSYLSDEFTDISDATWYTFRVTGVAGIPGIKATPGHYVWVNLSYYRNGWYYERWERRWVEGTPGRKAVPARDRASIIFTSDKLSQTSSVWVAIYEQVDSGFRLVKSKAFKQGKNTTLKFTGKADVNYYARITPYDSSVGSYSVNVTRAAIH
jgi:hypothetical protein